MNLLLPVAGQGVRLRPHTLHRPKPLVHLAGDTVLGHVLGGIEGALHLDQTVFIVGHLGGQIEAWVRTNRPWLDARFVTQPEPRGQAHALGLAREYLAGPQLIVFADTIFDIDLGALERLPAAADGALHLMPVDDPRHHGVAVLRADGTVERLIEKPASMENKLTVVGVYYVRDGAWLAAAIDRLIAEARQTRGEYYLADAFQIMLDEGARFVAQPVRAWEDCGTVEALLAAQQYLLQRRPGEISPEPSDPSTLLIPPVHIAPGAVIERSVVGPYVHIGPGCRIADSVVGPFVSLAGEARLSRAVARDVIAEAGAVIEDAVVAESVIGAGVRVAGWAGRCSVGDGSVLTTRRQDRDGA